MMTPQHPITAAGPARARFSQSSGVPVSSRITAAGLAVVILLASAVRADTAKADPPLEQELEVDFLCGVTAAPRAGRQLVRTRILISNLEDRFIMVRNLVSLNSYRPSEITGPDSKFYRLILNPGQTVELSCNDIKELFFEGQQIDWDYQMHFSGRIFSHSRSAVSWDIELTQINL